MVSSQRHDIRLGKRVTTHRTASLSVEDSGDLRIIEFLSQLTHQLHDLLRSFRCGCPRCEPFDIPFGDGSSFPYDANAITFFFGGELNLLDQTSKQSLAIPIRRRRTMPHLVQILGQLSSTHHFLFAQRSGVLPRQLRLLAHPFQLVQLVVPPPL